MTEEFNPERVLRVATSSDSGYLTYLAVLAVSLQSSQPANTHVELTVIHSDLDDVMKENLRRCAPSLSFKWLQVQDSDIWRELPDPLRAPYYFRCLIADAYPTTVDRCIYLDADTLVRRSLLPLMRMDLGGAIVGAALDYFLPRLGEAISPWARLGLDPDAEYFNSGVLLVDLHAWRGEQIGTRALAICESESDHLLAQGKWPQHDQFGLNTVLHGRWLRIDQTWNYLSEMPSASPDIVHYCGGGKPTSRSCQPEFAKWFQDAQRATP